MMAVHDWKGPLAFNQRGSTAHRPSLRQNMSGDSTRGWKTLSKGNLMFLK